MDKYLNKYFETFDSANQEYESTTSGQNLCSQPPYSTLYSYGVNGRVSGIVAPYPVDDVPPMFVIGPKPHSYRDPLNSQCCGRKEGVAKRAYQV
jgi:hypothetical protein